MHLCALNNSYWRSEWINNVLKNNTLLNLLIFSVLWLKNICWMISLNYYWKHCIILVTVRNSNKNEIRSLSWENWGPGKQMFYFPWTVLSKSLLKSRPYISQRCYLHGMRKASGWEHSTGNQRDKDFHLLTDVSFGLLNIH